MARTFDLRLFVGFFHYHPRVLDAWVSARIDSAKEGFLKKNTVSDRAVHICVPVIQDGNTIAQFTSKNIRSSFEKERACLLIWGEGGAGKTSLACQIAKWAMSDLEAERLCKHQMLPVLIEEELDVDSTASKPPLIAAMRGQMQDLTNEIEPISEELLERLLRRRRIIVLQLKVHPIHDGGHKLVGTRNLNNVLQQLINPPAPEKVEITRVLMKL